MNNNTVVWIVGASSGIGYALAEVLLEQEQCRLIVSARRQEPLQILRQRHPERVYMLPLDISDSAQMDTAIQQAAQAFGRIDILVNNAGIAHKSKAIDTYDAVDRHIMEVNYFGNIWLTKRVAKLMTQQGGGKIAVVSSVLGKFGLPNVSTYCASKHAIYGYYEALRYELKAANIAVQIISPGFVNTEITLNSVREDGSTFGKNSVAQEKGMSAHKFARRMVRVLKSSRQHAYIGGIETLMPRIKFFFPRLFQILMFKLHRLS
ncbi:MAG: SDR family NAD(P)-dependent oxidoreductase [Sphingobacteriales bacterium]|nr:SDR family NAD(P)-dependent oxidoreductase [Sphingobacteriales bacterium]